MTNYAALDHVFRIQTTDAPSRAGLEHSLQDLLSPLHAGSAYMLREEREGFVVRMNDDVVVEKTSRSHAVAMLLWHINQEAVRRTEALMLHAGCVVKDGKTVLLPAPMEHGKTTTVTGLLLHGYDYVTDEAVAFDLQTLSGRGYPKALSIDDGSWPLFPQLAPVDPLTPTQWQVPVSSFARLSADVPPVRLAVSPRFVAGGATELAEVSRAQMLMLLAESTFGFTDRPKAYLESLTRLLDGVACYRLQIGGLDAAVRVIDELVNAC